MKSVIEVPWELWPKQRGYGTVVTLSPVTYCTSTSTHNSIQRFFLLKVIPIHSEGPPWAYTPDRSAIIITNNSRRQPLFKKSRDIYILHTADTGDTHPKPCVVRPGRGWLPASPQFSLSLGDIVLFLARLSRTLFLPFGTECTQGRRFRSSAVRHVRLAPFAARISMSLLSHQW